jgi:LmbE family N-acetylglucosaminyl deacetylase
MAVHAHPDDEASTTGGILARYADEGVRTVLVTCTNGELGDAADGTKPGEPGHDGTAVAKLRRRELERSCEILKVSDLELLGYHDSGMDGWPQNGEDHVFWNTPVAEAAERLAELMRRYRPDVVVTYDPNGFYGHPDHIQAHRITVAAYENTGIAKKLYYPAIPKSAIERFADLWREDGDQGEPARAEPAQAEPDIPPDFGTPDDEIAAWIDCSGWVEAQFRALGAHASQPDNQIFLRLGLERFSTMFSVECFVRAYDSTGAPVPERDLFAGIR